MPGNKKMDSLFMESSAAPSAGMQPSCCSTAWRDDFGKKILMTLVGVLLVYLIIYVGTLMRNNMRKYQFIGQADQMERTITVNGTGKVNGSNDIAITTLGYSNTDKDVAVAQVANKKVMDAVMNDLKKLGVADKDMQTEYSIYPDYSFTQDRGQELKGYRVSNNVTVKIRDLSKMSAVLSLAGKHGANQVNGLNFTIDDPENLKLQARDKALSDAIIKAQRLTQTLGVRLIEVVSYNEYEGGPEPIPMYARAEGLGGGGDMGGPEIVARGSRDVVMNVNVTFKIGTR